MFSLDIIRRSVRSLKSASLRSLLTIFAIGVGAFALTLTLGASNGVHNYANNIIQSNFNPATLIVSASPDIFSSSDSSQPQLYDERYGSITNAAGASKQVKQLTDSDITRISQIKGVDSVRPNIDVNAKYLTRDGMKKYIATLQSYDAYRNPELLAGTIPRNIKNGSVIMPEGFISALGFTTPSDAIGKQVRVALQKQITANSLSSIISQLSGNDPSTSIEKSLTVIAVTKKPSSLIQPGTALYLFTSSNDITAMNDYTTKSTTSYHKYLTAYANVQDGTNSTKLMNTQSLIKQAGYGAQSFQDTEKLITQFINVLGVIVAVFGLIAVVASVFGVVNTMYISVLQRTREIGLMKALGMHRSDINKLFLFEAALLGLLGGTVGALLALVVGFLANPYLSKKIGIGSTHLIRFKPLQIVSLLLVLMLISLLAGVLPARKAAKLDPITALRTE
jgi:putative ABC transport system permease protein